MFGCKHPHVYEELLACLYSDLRKLLKHEICTGLYLRNFPPGCSGIFLYFLLIWGRSLEYKIKMLYNSVNYTSGIGNAFS